MEQITTSIGERYFRWICNSVCADESYLRVLYGLHCVKCSVRVARDMNRLEDGENMRYRFASLNDIPYPEIAATIDRDQCSALEMMAALSLRAGEHVFGYPLEKDGAVWMFWEMFRSLGLTENSTDISLAIDRVMERRFDADGKGGLFYIPGIETDMRGLELWAQALAFISVNYERFMREYRSDEIRS